MVPAMGVTTRAKDVFTGMEPVLITSAAITYSIWISREVVPLVMLAQNTGQLPVQRI